MSEEHIEETHVEETTSQETEELDLDNEQVEAEGGEAEDVEALKAELKKTKELNKQLYARTKKGPKKTAKTTEKSSDNSGLTREEAILFARGLTEDEVDLASKLAKVNDISIIEATEDPYFKTKVEGRLKKEKSEKASLGASGGSNKFSPKDVGEMSREEHIELFHKIMGNA